MVSAGALTADERKSLLRRVWDFARPRPGDLSGYSDEDLRQLQGFQFEAAKHLTTLNTAAALVVVALNRNIDLALWPLLFFALSLAAGVTSMSFLSISGPSRRAVFALAVAGGAFVAGVYGVFGAAVNP